MLAESILMAEVAADLGFRVQRDEFQQETYRLVIDHAETGERATYIRESNVDINPAASCDIARDKPVATAYLLSLGLSVVPTMHVTPRTGITEIAWPAPWILKPARGYEGRGVYEVSSYDSLREAYVYAQAFGDDLVLQPKVFGPVYRVVILAGQVMAAVVGRRPTITADGTSTLAELVEAWAYERKVEPHDAYWHLREQGFARDVKFPRGCTLELLPTTNAARYGNRQVATHALPENVKDLAIATTKALNLNWAGVDIVDENGTQPMFLEINSAPDLTGRGNFDVLDKNKVRSIYHELLTFLLSRMKEREWP